MKLKHTPGPWEIERYSHGLLQIVGDVRPVGDDEEHVTTIVEEISYQHEGNARLIAAAPELKEALQKLVLLYEADEGCRQMPEYKAAVAALKKATSNSN